MSPTPSTSTQSTKPSRRRRPKSKPKSHYSSSTTSANSSLISSYHSTLKRISQLESSPTPNPLVLSRLKNKLKVLGGLKGYQAASTQGVRKGGGKGTETGKWLGGFMREMMEVERGEDKGKRKEKEKCLLLDVGSYLGTAYISFPFILPTYIDLNPSPSAPHVLKADFFEFPIPEKADDKFDIVALSLVLNFVGDLKARARMILHSQSFLRPSSPHRLLYLVLPLACLSNSRYLNPSRFQSILSSLNFDEVVRTHDSDKLSYWLARWNGVKGRKKGDEHKWKKEEVRGGAKRNNFCIVVE